MPTSGDAQIVRKRSHFSIAQLIGKARYRLHTLAMREFTAPMPSSIATIRLRGSARRSVLLPRSATTLFGIPLPILKSVAARIERVERGRVGSSSTSVLNGRPVEYTHLMMVGSRWSTRLPGLLGSVRLVVARPVPRASRSHRAGAPGHPPPSVAARSPPP